MDIPRSPVVTILGHVDHGKTSLLDMIRKSHLAEKEHGGITQKIGAYEIDTGIKGYKTSKISFIDTPGHEAFSKLRARGANVADIALLLIDAKDSLMPQTIESISHIKVAKIPYIVVLNKIDLPEANPDKVKRDLLKYEVLVEGKGGNIPAVNISAKTGQGISELLEAILLVASDLNLNYKKDNSLQAYILETKKDRRGIVVSAVVKNGVLKIRQQIYTETTHGKVRSIFNDLGQSIKEAIPSMPVEILGFESMPKVGDLITDKPQDEKGEQIVEKKTIDFDSAYAAEKKEKKISLLIKADFFGSLEAISASLSDNKNIEIILQAVGGITKSDIFLAKTTKSIIIGFNTRLDNETRDLAKQEKVIIKTYSIIYELIEELNEVANLIKEKEEKDKSLKGEAKILANFIIEKEKVLGIKVTKGKINLGDKLEAYRNDKIIGHTKLVSLQIRAKKVEEVKKDQEAGLIISPELDIKVGDMVKSIL